MDPIPCKACGNPLPATSNFCPSCGAAVVHSASPSDDDETPSQESVDSTSLMSAVELEEFFATSGADGGGSTDAPDAGHGPHGTDRVVSVMSGSIDLKQPDQDPGSGGGEEGASEDAEGDLETSISAAMTLFEMDVLDGIDRGQPAGGGTDAGMPVMQPPTRQVVTLPGQPETATESMDLTGLRDARARVQEAATRGLDTSGLRRKRQQASTEALDTSNLRRERAQGAETKAADLSVIRAARNEGTVGSGTPRSPLEMPVVRIGGVQGIPEDAPDPDEVATRFEMKALSPDDIRKAIKAAGQDDTHEGDDDPVDVATRPENEPVDDEEAQRRKNFSETQWFMKGAEVDADLLEGVDHEDYDRDEGLGTGERKKFTLRSEDDD